MMQRDLENDGVREFGMRCDTDVTIKVRDYDGVIGRYVEGRETHPYGCRTEEEILCHLAYNAVANGVWQINELDGWADLAKDAAVLSVEVVYAEPL